MSFHSLFFSQLCFSFPYQRSCNFYWQRKLEKVFQILKQGRKFLCVCVCAYICLYMCMYVFKDQWSSLRENFISIDLCLKAHLFFSINWLVKEYFFLCSLPCSYPKMMSALAKILILYLKQEQNCKAISSSKQSKCNCPCPPDIIKRIVT